MTKKIDKAFSIKDEGHLNKNNIIFNNPNIARLVNDITYVNNQLVAECTFITTLGDRKE